MTMYWAVFSARFRTLLQYRAAAIAGFGCQLFWGLMRVMIFTAFYHSVSTVQPMTLEQTITYLWLVQALLMVVPWTGDAEISNLIRTGNVAFEMCRPVDLYNLWFARALAQRTAPAILRCFPMFILAGLFLGLKPPASLEAGLAFLVAILGGIFLSASFTVLQSVFLFWTISGVGAARLFPSLVLFCSGMLVPLPLFPKWAQPILDFLPFRGIIDAPFRLYLGHLPPSETFSLMGHQLIWLSVIVLFTRWLLGRGLRRAVIQGG